MNIVPILKAAISHGASDVHLVTGNPPMMRINGELMSLPGAPELDAKTSTMMIYELLTDVQKAHFEKEWSVDATFGIENVRFRLNVSLQRLGMEAVFRILH